MRILVTGSTGQVGRALVTALAPLSNVIATDRLSLDLARPERVKKLTVALQPDVIVNAAAYTDVERAEIDEELATAVNTLSVGELAAAARELQVPLLHYSTDYVFDGTKTSPYLEDDQPAPLSAYGRSKLGGERMILDSGCANLILRTSWVYDASGRNFLTAMLRLASEREELRVVDDQMGAPTHAGFIAAATARIVEQIVASDVARRRVDEGDVVNLVNGGVTSWFGFASEIFASAPVQESHRTPRLRRVKASEFPTRAQRPANSRLSTEKARTVWQLKVPDWRESLAECLLQLQ